MSYYHFWGLPSDPGLGPLGIAFIHTLISSKARPGVWGEPPGKRWREGDQSHAANMANNRDSPITNMKISGRYLPITTCYSLVDAVFSQKLE